ncbi:MAG: hypothetical protein QM741_08505 [Rudaea sp.]|uniref:hypothetical protein n=1 Tax=Rudaea sp. TaxID=2136325 RepID=UPI0039E44A56
MATKLHAALRIAAIAACLAAGMQSADAAVQDYQIMRLLSYHSDCGVPTLARLPKAAPWRYHAICSNTAAYPSGVDVECADKDDERSCRVLTQPQHFNLNAMAPQLSK